METKIYISKICGLCYGSNNAINRTRDALKKNKNVVLYKEILHNKNVMDELKNSGAEIKENLENLNKSDYVIIRAHGEKETTFSYLKRKKISYLDCTCPNVKYIHLLVKRKEEEGYKIIIIGKKTHPEVVATSGWCNNPIILENEGDFSNLILDYSKYYLVCQTTFSKDKALLFIDMLKNIMNNGKKEFDYKYTICNAQKSINEAAIKLADDVDIMIIIGGENSSNSIELFNNVSKVKKAFFIHTPEDILSLVKSKKIKKGQRIGITAGASTMKEDIAFTKELLERELN